jgi:hypothetical protein
MVVEFLGEKPGGRSAANNAGKRTYQRTFKLTTSGKDEGPWAVGSHPYLPVIGSRHPDDNRAYCISVSVSNTDPWKGWEVSCSYSDERSVDENNPALDEVKISWSAENYEEVVLFDVAGEAILNTAGDPFSDAPVRDSSRLTASISLNVTSVPSWVLGYQNSVNSDSCSIGGLSISPQQAKMSGLTIGEKQYRNDTPFYSLSYQLSIRREGWRLQPLNAGFRQWKYLPQSGVTASARLLVDCVNSGDQKPVSEPVLLDEDGEQVQNPSWASALFLDFQLYRAFPFGGQLPGVDA